MLASPAPTTCPFSNRTTVQLPRSILPDSRRSSFVPSQSHLTNTALTTAPPELEIPLIYLPPLLSLLPIDVERDPTHSPAETSLSFDFDSPSVGFTTSRLPSIDVASIALHYALYKFRPTGKDYASVSYFDAFNWDELRLPIDVEREWYVVAFRSTRAPNSASIDLYDADRLAHEEAASAGGLLAYWFGTPLEGINLATCIWQSRKHARDASSGENHVIAMKLAAKMYSAYELERYVLKKKKGETGVTIEEWIEGEVAF